MAALQTRAPCSGPGALLACRLLSDACPGPSLRGLPETGTPAPGLLGHRTLKRCQPFSCFQCPGGRGARKGSERGWLGHLCLPGPSTRISRERDGDRDQDGSHTVSLSLSLGRDRWWEQEVERRQAEGQGREGGRDPCLSKARHIDPPPASPPDKSGLGNEPPHTPRAKHTPALAPAVNI